MSPSPALTAPTKRGRHDEPVAAFRAVCLRRLHHPGPTNILVLSNSSRFGLLAALPIIFGACAAAALIVLLVGLGAGEWLLRHPPLQQAMARSGSAGCSTARQIARSPTEAIEDDAASRRLGALAPPGCR